MVVVLRILVVVVNEFARDPGVLGEGITTVLARFTAGFDADLLFVGVGAGVKGVLVGIVVVVVALVGAGVVGTDLRTILIL